MADAQPLTIMVPLGGVGARFQREGYASPKPFVTALGKPMILWVLDSLVLSPADELVIVYNPEFIPTKFWGVVTASYPRLRLVELPGATRGAAETVMIGLRGLPRDLRSRPVMLVDGDTFYGEDIVSKYRAHCATSHGVFYFVDTQPKPIYSYITFEPSSSLITQVKEKVKISDFANSGCYCFMSGTELEAECQVGTPADHLRYRLPPATPTQSHDTVTRLGLAVALSSAICHLSRQALLDAGSTQLSQDAIGEYYTSGVIAQMIEAGGPFRAIEIQPSQYHVLGTPSQLQAFCRSWREQPALRICFDLDNTLVTVPEARVAAPAATATPAAPAAAPTAASVTVTPFRGL